MDMRINHFPSDSACVDSCDDMKIDPARYIAKTDWGRETRICVSKLNIVGSNNSLSPGWHQAIILNQFWVIVNLNLDIYTSVKP